MTNLNIRIDEADKQAFDAVCEQLGMSMSTAFNIFAKAVIRQRRIPFEIGLERFNVETLAAIDDVDNGRNLSGPYHSMRELREALNA